MMLPTPLRHGLKRLALRVAPGECLRRFAPGYPVEPEFALVPRLCDRRRLAVDVGASTGIYTIWMLAHARACVAFEPRPSVAARLKEKFTFAGPRVTIHAVALSAQDGTTVLRVPRHEGGRATIDADNPLDPAAETDTVTVPMRRLDGLVPADGVGFIKIDVEGHELAVLKGADACLRASRPALLIEIDDTMHPHTMRDTTAFLTERGYRGYFMWAGRIHPLDALNPAVHQRATSGPASTAASPYVRNFVFVHQNDDRISSVATKCRFAPFQPLRPNPQSHT